MVYLVVGGDCHGGEVCFDDNCDPDFDSVLTSLSSREGLLTKWHHSL